MQDGQIVNNPDQALFSSAITSGSGELSDDANPDIDQSVYSGVYRDSGNLGNIAMFSAENNLVIEQPTKATNEIAGELVSRPEHITSNLEHGPEPEINPNSVQLVEVIENDPLSNTQSQTPLAIASEFGKNGEIPPKTIEAVMEETRKYTRSNQIHPADIIDMIDQITEGYSEAFKSPSRNKQEGKWST